jgi:hypothetical protein
VNPRDLMCAHIDALFTSDSAGKLLRVNVPDGGPAPRFFVGRTNEGCEWRVRADVPEAIAAKLEAALAAEPAGDELLKAGYGASAYEAILVEHGPIQQTWTGPAYLCPPGLTLPGGVEVVRPVDSSVMTPHLEDWAADVGVLDHLFVSLVDEKAVSVCASVRHGPAGADEVGVDTAPAFRRRGHGLAVVAAWADAVRQHGRVPLYSTSWTNTASMALAQRLGLIRYGSTLHVT